MATQIGVGLSDLPDGARSGADAARVALAGLSGPPALALLFTSHPQPKQVLKGVRSLLGDIALLGATTGGQYTHAGYVEDGVGIMLVSGDDLRFYPQVHRRRWFGRQQLLAALQGTTPEGLGSQYRHRALMLFPDDQSMNLDDVVARAMTETGMLYDILGGPALTLPKPPPPRPPAIFYSGTVFRSGMSASEVLSRSPIGMALGNGWTPVSGPYRVTASESRRVRTIDGRPSREVYEDFFEEQHLNLEADQLSALLLNHPIGICEQGDCKVSVAMGFDPSGALMVTSAPPVGSLIHILGAEPLSMVTAAKRAIQQAMARIRPQTPAGALFIDCVSTGMVLDKAYATQRQAVQETLGDVPFLGFRSHGVLARLEGQIAGHYECTVGAWVFPTST